MSCHDTHGPISTLSCDARGDEVLFSCANRVYHANSVPTGCYNERYAQYTVVLELPHGAAVTAVTGVKDGNTGVITSVFAASASNVFGVRIANGTCPSDDLKRVIQGGGGRVMRLHICEQGKMLVAVTAVGSVYFVSLHEAENVLHCAGHEGALPHAIIVTGPSIGISLSVDCMEQVIAGVPHLRVFSGTYAGEVCDWRVPLSSMLPMDGARICTEAKGVAIISVKALLLVPPCESSLLTGVYLAAGSIDGCASLFFCPITALENCQTVRSKELWVCLWRSSENMVLCTRVLDVALHWNSPTCSLWYAMGGGDGKVFTYDLAPSTDVSVPWTQHTLYIGSHHGGHGTFRVGFTALGEDTLGSRPRLLSCGFDGTLALTTLVDGSSSSYRVSVPFLSAPLANGGAARVRGIRIDSCGRTVICTEVGLLVRGVGIDSPKCLMGVTWATATLSQLTCSGSHRRELPVVLSTVVFPSGLSCAVMGTSHGGFVSVQYACIEEGLPEVITSASWKAYGNCLLMECVVTELTQRDACAVIASFHVSGQVVVSAFRPLLRNSDDLLQAMAVCDLGGSRLPISTISIVSFVDKACERQRWVVLGDRDGYLYGLRFFMEGLDDSSTAGLDSQLSFQVRVVALPIVLVYEDAHAFSQECNEPPLLTVVTANGRHVYIRLNMEILREHSISEQKGEYVPPCCPWPLRFPFDVVQTISATPTVWVTKHGTVVSVYTRAAGRSGWRRVDSYYNVVAPRLLSARCIEDRDRVRVVFTHCSDGVHVEGYTYAYALSVVHNQQGCSNRGTTILFGGVVPGKEFNCSLYIPSPLDCFVHGNEDSGLLVQSRLQPSLSNHSWIDKHAPISVYGPHTSNIIALCLLKPTPADSADDHQSVRFASVGGLATLVVWQWCTQWGWRVVACTNANRGNATEGHACVNRTRHTSTSEVCMPRYLSVCQIGERSVLVGTSAGTAMLWTFDSHAMTCTRMWQLNSDCPKPIGAVSIIEEEAWPRYALAGDTNGVVYVVDVERATTTVRYRVEQSALNALSSGKGIYGSADSVKKKWHFWAVHDSSNGHRIGLVMEDTSNMESCTVEPLDSFCTGMTAGRGACWTSDAKSVFIVNEERLVMFQRTSLGRWQCVGARRANVRCPSGLTLLETEGLELAVCGHGTELLRWS